MTAEFLIAQNLEKITRSEIKTLKYCGFNVRYKSGWNDGVFGIEVRNISQEDFDGLLEYQKQGQISDKIVLYKK